MTPLTEAEVEKLRFVLGLIDHLIANDPAFRRRVLNYNAERLNQPPDTNESKTNR